MLIPIVVIAVFSFGATPKGKLTFGLDHGFTTEYWSSAFSTAGAERSAPHQPAAGGALDRDLDRDRDADGDRAGPPQVPRPAGGEPADRDPDGDAGGGDRRLAALDVHLLLVRARLRDAADRPRDVLDQLRRRRRALAADRLRPPSRGGGGRPRRDAARHLPHRHPAAAGARDHGRGAARLRALDRRLRDLQLQLGNDGDLPALRVRGRPARHPGPGQRPGDDAVRRDRDRRRRWCCWQQRRAERMAAVRPSRPRHPLPQPRSRHDRRRA